MTKKSSWKHLSLAIAIIIVFAVFINIGVQTFYPGPDFEDFKPEDCKEDFQRKPIAIDDELETPSRDCYEYSNRDYQKINEKYERNVFIVLIISGIIGIILGFLLTVTTVGMGFSYGGILTLLIAIIRYWSSLQDYAKFILLAIALAILIWLGYKKLK